MVVADPQRHRYRRFRKACGQLRQLGFESLAVDDGALRTDDGNTDTVGAGDEGADVAAVE